MQPTVIDHPQYGQLISIQDFAAGFGCSPQKLNLLCYPESLKVKGRVYVRLSEAIQVVRDDYFSGGGCHPTSEFQAFIRQFRDEPQASEWREGDEPGHWIMNGRECTVSISPLQPDDPRGNYQAMLRVQGDAELWDDWWSTLHYEWPRYYFGLDAAKAELEACLKRWNQFVEPSAA